MTILAGDVEKAQTISDCLDRLTVSRAELFEAMDAEIQKQMLNDEVRDRESVGDTESTVETIDVKDVHQDVVNEYVAETDDYELITQILENRDQLYVHLYDGYVHTFVEVYQSLNSIQTLEPEN